MSDQDLEPLDPDLAALLDAEREPEAIPAAARERVLARVESSLGFGGPGGGNGGGAGESPHGGNGVRTAPPGARGRLSPPPARDPPTPATGLLGKPLAATLGVFLLGAASGAGALAGLRPAPPPQVVTVLVSAPAPPFGGPPGDAPAPAVTGRPDPLNPPPQASEIPKPPASPPPRARPAGGPSSAEAPGRDVDLAAERAVLEVARSAVGRGQGGPALQALSRHAAEFPRGRLAEEREALWIQALVLAGRRSEARARAEQFRSRFPGSLQRPAIAAMLDDSATEDLSTAKPAPR